MRTHPEWLKPFLAIPEKVVRSDLTRFDTDGNDQTRPGAILILLGEGEDGPDVVITERSADLRAHAGQPSFPGGAIDATDSDAVSTALREAEEEIGISRVDLEVFGVLPKLWLPPSNFLVTPVMAWWHTPKFHSMPQSNEVSRVERIPLTQLVNPTNRLKVAHPNGFVSAAFDVAGMRIWGFTGNILDRLIALADLEQDWDQDRILPL